VCDGAGSGGGASEVGRMRKVIRHILTYQVIDRDGESEDGEERASLEVTFDGTVTREEAFRILAELVIRRLTKLVPSKEVEQ
jgi:hypothetical protein